MSNVIITGIEVSIELLCRDCNGELYATFNAEKDLLVVDGCETCSDSARAEGHDEGYGEGLDKGGEE